MRRPRHIRRVPATLPLLLIAGSVLASAASAQRALPEPAAAQPSLPRPIPFAPVKPGSPVVQSLVDEDRPPLDVRKHELPRPRHRHAAYPAALRHGLPRDLDRPALAGVELVAPLPPPGEPPHIGVPLPAYPLDSVAAAFTIPAPPVVCHRVPRDPDAPDPRIYREIPVACEPDNP